MLGPFASPKLILANGKDHIQRLQQKFFAWGKSNEAARVVESDPETGEQVHKIIFSDTAFSGFPAVVFDCATNMRSVLDQTGYAAALASGVAEPKSAYFPIADDEIQLKNVIGRKRCKDLPPEILDLFVAFKPYKGGNDTIWALNKLANSKKHAALMPVGVGKHGFYGGNIKVSLKAASDKFTLVDRGWNSAKNELTLVRATSGVQVDYNTNFTFAVAFEDSQEAIGGKAVIPTLNAMASEVERVLMGTEAECRRLGFI